MIDIEAHRDATASLMTLLAKGDTAHSEQFYGGLARRLVANALLVRGYLEPVVEGEKTQLRQQQTQQFDDVDWWAEHVHHLKREYEDALAILERIRQGRMAEFDPDARGEDEDDRRAKEQRQDEAANENAPTAKGAA